MLKMRGQIPPLTARTPAGQTVRAGDFRQKHNLVIAFLRPGDASRAATTFDSRGSASADFLSKLVGHAAELVEREAEREQPLTEVWDRIKNGLMIQKLKKSVEELRTKAKVVPFSEHLEGVTQ